MTSAGARPRGVRPILIRAAFAILDRGAANNPDQWVYPFDAGHIALMNLKDYPLAEKYFEQCMKIPGAPEFVERLRANAIFKKGDLKTSWETWLDIYKRAPDERTKRIASNHLYNVKATIDEAALEDAAAKYRERFGRLPADLGALVRAGFLRRGPQGPRREGLPLRPGDGKGQDGDQPMETLTLVFVARGRPRLRQLLQRRHLPPAAGAEPVAAPLRLPRLRRPHQALRQHPGPLLPPPPRQVPQVRAEDLARSIRPSRP